MTTAKSRLGVTIDGERLPDDEARALWERFSDWMEDHRGDLAGFAAAEGLASIHPGVDGGLPVLLGSKTDTAQRPYAPARSVMSEPGSPSSKGKNSPGGSTDRQNRPGRGPGSHAGHKTKPKKR